MRRLRRGVVAAALAWAALGSSALAQTVAPVGVSPASVPVGVGTPVTVTATISDPSVLAPSVVLQRVDEAGRVLATLGPVVDDGSNGDATAGDKVFTRAGGDLRADGDGGAAAGVGGVPGEVDAGAVGAGAGDGERARRRR